MINNERVELVTFGSIFPAEKEAKVKAVIAEIEELGWKFTESRSTRITTSMRHVGGALDLHFVKDLADSTSADK